MSEFIYQCATCKKEIGGDTGEVIYCEGTLEFTHGMGKCQDCYAKDHKACVKCNTFLMDGYKYCPFCGNKI
jgi:hypothetical protein